MNAPRHHEADTETHPAKLVSWLSFLNRISRLQEIPAMNSPLNLIFPVMSQLQEVPFMPAPPGKSHFRSNPGIMPFVVPSGTIRCATLPSCKTSDPVETSNPPLRPSSMPASPLSHPRSPRPSAVPFLPGNQPGQRKTSRHSRPGSSRNTNVWCVSQQHTPMWPLGLPSTPTLPISRPFQARHPPSAPSVRRARAAPCR